MQSLLSFIKRHTLLAGFTAALGSLLMLVGFQFVWLERLEKMSVLAHQAALRNYLDAVTEKFQAYYREVATETLDVPATVFTSGKLDAVAYQWRKRPAPWASRLFLVDYTHEPFGRYLVLDPTTGRLYSPPASEESMAMIVACTPWQLLKISDRPADSSGLVVDERNPSYRMVLKPVVDEAGHVLGIAGAILDPAFVETALFPKVAKKSMPEFFGDTGDVVVSLRSGGHRVVASSASMEGVEVAESASLPFVFTDWSVALQHKGFDPARWARTSIGFDMALVTALALALLGSLVLSLRAANRVMKLSQMKSEFVSNVSHELRTPLASIRVFSELLRLGRVSAPEKVQEYGEKIEGESRRLSRLIENILDFSRIESGHKTYRFAEGDLGEVVRSVLDSFENALRTNGFEVRVEEGAALPPFRMDPEAIAQALQNLVDNAVKYSGESREIVVGLGREGDEAVVWVRDRGVGIPRDEQRKIFERFHRVGSGLVHDVKGTGLGLSIVQHVVKAHGGSIVVDSALGQGSTFRVRLPLRPAASEAAPAPA